MGLRDIDDLVCRLIKELSYRIKMIFILLWLILGRFSLFVRLFLLIIIVILST